MIAISALSTSLLGPVARMRPSKPRHKGRPTVMGYEHAVRHLRHIAGACELHLSWPGNPVVVGAYVFGELLEGPEKLGMIDVALTVALPPTQIQGNVMPPLLLDVMKRTRLHRLPVNWYYQPSAHSIVACPIYRPVRIWSPDGTLPHVIELIANRRFADLQPELSPTAELRLPNGAAPSWQPRDATLSS
jgi:hypothetical protein